MDFISETTFKSPIKGGIPAHAGNDKDDLVIESNVSLDGNLTVSGNAVLGPLSSTTINGHLDVNGCRVVLHAPVTADQLTVSGPTELGATTADSLTVTGTTTLANVSTENLDVSGVAKITTASVETLTVSQPVDFNEATVNHLEVNTLYGCGGVRHDELCVYSGLKVYEGVTFISKDGGGTYDERACSWTLDNTNGALRFETPNSADKMYINASVEIMGRTTLTNASIENLTIRNNITACGNIVSNSCIIGSSIHGGHISSSGNITANGSLTVDADINSASLSTDSITLAEEKITSWSDLAQYVSGGGGESSPKIKRFTSPTIPQNCSQFYFEGADTVTGTELPFIQVRETDTGKLVQMDVWVNLDEACTGLTLGKPVAEIEPCSTANTAAGKWTAIVMN